MAKPELEWMVKVRTTAGEVVDVYRRQTEGAAKKKAAKAKRRGFQVEMKPEPRSHHHRDRGRYVNCHPNSRRQAA
jgi:hypothetical protein